MSRRLVIGSVVLSMTMLVMPAGAPSIAFAAGCQSAAGAAACLGLVARPYVTPGQAERVIGALWEARENERVRQQTKSLSRLDTGSAALTDVAVITSVKCGCGSFYSMPGRRRFGHAVIYLPRQRRYPLFFAADVSEVVPGSSAKADAHAVLIVTRTSSTQPWRIAFQLYDTGDTAWTPYAPPTLGPAGYDLSPPNSATLGRGWFAEYVAYLNQLKRTGKQPVSTPFAPGPLTSGTHLQEKPNGYTLDGVTYEHTFKPGPFGGPWIFASGGTTTICGDVAEYSVARPADPGHLLVQPTDRMGWDWELAPGDYRTITTLYEWPVCIYPEGSGRLGVDGPSTGGYPIEASGDKTTA